MVNRDEVVARREFHSVQGEFEAWKTAILGAASLQGSLSTENQSNVESFYEGLNKAVKEERLSDESFGDIGTDYVRLVLNAKKMSEEKFAEELGKLQVKASESLDGVIDAATGTPNVNSEQARARELLWFGIATEKISKGKRSTIERKMDALDSLKLKAKSDKKLSEREREKLEEEADEIVIELMESLAS